MSRVVLVVDDDAPVARLVGIVLAREGLQTELLPDGLAALARLSRGDVALVLTDMTMPGMSGLELVRAAEARGLRTPFLLMSAFLDAETERALLAEPAIAGLLRKPFELARLVTDVRAILAAAECAGSAPRAEARAASPSDVIAEVIAAVMVDAPVADAAPGLALAPLWLFQRWPGCSGPRPGEGRPEESAALLGANAGATAGAPLSPC